MNREAPSVRYVPLLPPPKIGRARNTLAIPLSWPHPSPHFPHHSLSLATAWLLGCLAAGPFVLLDIAKRHIKGLSSPVTWMIPEYFPCVPSVCMCSIECTSSTVARCVFLCCYFYWDLPRITRDFCPSPTPGLFFFFFFFFAFFFFASHLTPPRRPFSFLRPAPESTAVVLTD